MASGSNWAIEEFPTSGDAPRVAVKDLIDMEGTRTSAGSRLVLSTAEPAREDARCLQRIRERGARIVGKANLHELAFGSTGINHWWGTPVNPIDPSLVPGGSSSGSAVAVAIGAADFALGTDTGGSVRIPAAACGILGLKTTWGRISNVGVYPLAPSLDTVGPLAGSAAALEEALEIMDSGYSPMRLAAPLRVALLVNAQAETFNEVIRLALSRMGAVVTEFSDIDLAKVHRSANQVISAEAYRSDSRLLREAHRLDPIVVQRLLSGAQVADHSYRQALEDRHAFQNLLEERFEDFDVLALATVPSAIPSMAKAIGASLNRNTLPFNFAGTPGLSLPLARLLSDEALGGMDSPQGGGGASSVPVSLQLVAPWDGEALLVAAAKEMEGRDLLFAHR
ncbi:MAG: amidase [Actinomycetota bacterium]|nr:amidase [Actinomycetota bacterium]